jgi:hypothetical protein
MTEKLLKWLKEGRGDRRFSISVDQIEDVVIVFATDGKRFVDRSIGLKEDFPPERLVGELVCLTEALDIADEIRRKGGSS